MAKIHPSILATAAGVLLLAVWPLIFGNAGQFYQVLGMTCLYGTLALAWNIYALSGAISLGHAAFFGLGAYGSALLNQHYHWSPLLTIPLGSLASVVFAVFWSWFFRRLRGVYLGLASLAAIEARSALARMFRFSRTGVPSALEPGRRRSLPARRRPPATLPASRRVRTIHRPKPLENQPLLH